MKKVKNHLAVLLVLALVLCLMPATAFALDENETEIISVPCVTKVTPTTISVKAMDNVQYRLGSTGTWTSDAVFSGLYPNTNYTVYYRYGTGDATSLGVTTTPQAEYITNGSATTIDSSATALSGVSISHNVSFQESFTLYYYIPVSLLNGYTNCRLFIQRKTFDAGATTCTYSNTIVPFSSIPTTVTNNVTRYTYLYKNIAAAQLGENIYISVYAEKDGVTYITPVDDYSIKKYAYNNLAKSTVSANMKSMLVDLLNYGAAAQVYFDRDKNHLVNADLSSEQRALANTSINADSLVNVKASTGSGDATITSNNVSFNNSTLLIYYVTFPENYDMTNVVFEATYTSSNAQVGNVKKTIPSSSFVWDATKQRYNITLSGITTTDYGCPITAVIKKNGTAISNVRTYDI